MNLRPIALLLPFTLAAFAQPQPRFEVATIKLAAPGSVKNRVMPSAPDRLSIANMSLIWLIYTAYGEGLGTSFNVSGGPAWANSTGFAIEAKAAQPTTQQELRRMLRTLLEERFQLKLRQETRMGDVYVLKLARADGKLGPNVKEWDGLCGGSAATSEEDPFIPRCPSGYRPPGLFLEGAPMYAAAEVLSLPQSRALLGTIVQDQTGLQGRYSMHLDFPFGAPRPADPAGFAGPTLFDAVRDQWGMTLERAKGPLHMLLIEDAKQPEEN